MNFKKTTSVIHLWLGLASGLVVFISLLAASVFVWEKELTAWYHHDAVYVQKVKPQKLSFGVLVTHAQNAVKGSPIRYLSIDHDPRKAYVFSASKESRVKGWTYNSNLEYAYNIYIDPYTGKINGIVDTRYDWIWCLYPLHVCLLLNYDAGHYIVGGATLIIFIMVFTGIVLWWPKNKAALKQRLWFRWKKTTKWRRKNYDFHNIGGIYTFLFILLFAATGLVWTFDWWTNGIYRILGNEPDKVFNQVPSPKEYHHQTTNAYDLAFHNAISRLPNWKTMSVGMPDLQKDSARAISFFIRYNSGQSGWDESDEYTYNSQTGQLYFRDLHCQKTLGAKWRNSNYAIHTGSIFGWPTKILATLVSLFCAFLPISGFLIWWGRKKKNRSVKKTI